MIFFRKNSINTCLSLKLVLCCVGEIFSIKWVRIELKRESYLYILKSFKQAIKTGFWVQHNPLNLGLLVVKNWYCRCWFTNIYNFYFYESLLLLIFRELSQLVELDCCILLRRSKLQPLRWLETSSSPNRLALRAGIVAW